MSDVVEICVGPSKSASMTQLREEFAGWLTGEQSGVATFHFEIDESSKMQELLSVASRIRKIAVLWSGETYTRNNFLHALYSRECEQQRRTKREAFEAAGSWWPTPDAEYLSLAYACAAEVEEDEPLDPVERQHHLDWFTGRELDESVWVRRALDHTRAGTDRVARAELEAQFDVLGWQIDRELTRAQELFEGERSLAYSSEERVVYFQPVDACRTCMRLHLEEDRKTPRLFLADELPAVGSNATRPLEDWLPTRPPLHLYCRCILSPWTIVTAMVPQDCGFPRGYKPVVTRLPSWAREPLRG